MMEQTMENEILKVAKQAISKAITEELIGYNKPLSKFANDVIFEHESEFKKIISGGVATLLNSKDFEDTLTLELHRKLAKILINKIGGELEKKVNELKQDATSRAKITLAIDKVMDEVLAK